MKTTIKVPLIPTRDDLERIEKELRAALSARGYPNPSGCRVGDDGSVIVSWMFLTREPPPELADMETLIGLLKRLFPHAVVEWDARPDRSDGVTYVNAWIQPHAKADRNTAKPRKGTALYAVSSGEYSDYQILGYLRGPEDLDLRALFREFLGETNLSVRFDMGHTDYTLFARWLVKHHGCRHIDVEEVHLPDD